MVTNSITNLAMIVQNYLNDSAFHKRRQTDFIQPREESISTYQDIVQRFVFGEISLANLRDELKILYKHPTWGAKGPGFLMEIHKLVSNHLPTNPDVLYVGADNNGVYDSLWETSAIAQSFSTIFHQILWPLFEVIRIYRQIGTAQAIKLVVHMLSHCLLQQYTELSQWLEALHAALCDAIVDQLQVLLPDELDVLLWYLKLDANTFCQRYNAALARLKPRRQAAHLEALGRIVDQQDLPYITDEQIEHLLEDEDEAPQIVPALLKDIFHLDRPLSQLPHFTRRLRTFKAERGL